MTDSRTKQGVQVRTIGHGSSDDWKDVMSLGLNALLEPGMIVRHPQEPDWGLGQVQSNIGNRITVNFEHRGKVVIDGSRISLLRDYEI